MNISIDECRAAYARKQAKDQDENTLEASREATVVRQKLAVLGVDASDLRHDYRGRLILDLGLTVGEDHDGGYLIVEYRCPKCAQRISAEIWHSSNQQDYALAQIGKVIALSEAHKCAPEPKPVIPPAERSAAALELIAAEIGRLQEAFTHHWNLE